MSFSPLRFLLLLTLLLAAGLAWLWLDEHGQPRNLTWVAPKAIAPDIKLPASAPKPASTASNPASFAAIMERPLFAPDRRPPPPPAPTPPPPPDPLANTQIHGIFTGANAGIMARVDGKLRRIKIDETIGPWTLKSIDGRDVTFTQGAENRQLRLAYARLNAPAAPTITAGTKAAPTQAPFSAPEAGGMVQRAEDETRERLRRRNELRASRGLPPLTD